MTEADVFADARAGKGIDLTLPDATLLERLEHLFLGNATVAFLLSTPNAITTLLAVQEPTARAIAFRALAANPKLSEAAHAQGALKQCLAALSSDAPPAVKSAAHLLLAEGCSALDSERRAAAISDLCNSSQGAAALVGLSDRHLSVDGEPIYNNTVGPALSLLYADPAALRKLAAQTATGSAELPYAVASLAQGLQYSSIPSLLLKAGCVEALVARLPEAAAAEVQLPPPYACQCCLL